MDREIGTLSEAITLLDEWIEHANWLQMELRRMQFKYQDCHGRCEELRAIVAQDYPTARRESECPF